MKIALKPKFKYFMLIGDKVINKIFGTQQENSITEIIEMINIELGKKDILIETQLDIEDEEEDISLEERIIDEMEVNEIFINQ